MRIRSYFVDTGKNKSVRVSSIFPSSGISRFVSLRYEKYLYYRIIVSLRFDIVAIASLGSKLRSCDASGAWRKSSPGWLETTSS